MPPGGNLKSQITKKIQIPNPQLLREHLEFDFWYLVLGFGSWVLGFVIWFLLFGSCFLDLEI